MWSRLHLKRGSWTIADQVIVSGGAFLVNVLLARQLPAPEYGTFAVLLGVMFALQIFISSLLLQPLAVRLPGTEDEAERTRLLGATLAFVALLSVALAAALTAILLLLGRADLAASALCCFLSWQLQETTRRGLLASFRHQAACFGDAVSYLGQAVVVVCLAAGDALSLAGAFYGMAATSMVAAAVQRAQLGLPWRQLVPERAVAAEYWSIGGPWALGNAVVSQLRGQILAWVLAAQGGMAAAAAFQAAVNVINLSNPVVLALCNIIPQTAAQAVRSGKAQAWRAARVYAYLAAPFFIVYAALISVAPQTLLVLLYGADSEYSSLAPVLQLLVAGALVGYAADVVVSFLLGVAAVRAAATISATGTLATLVLAPVLVGLFGLTGGCLVVMAAGVARFAVSVLVMSKLAPRAGHRVASSAGLGTPAQP